MILIENADINNKKKLLNHVQIVELIDKTTQNLFSLFSENKWWKDVDIPETHNLYNSKIR
jgi:hypothetical protein